VTGPEHYKQAEALLAKATTYDPEPETARQAAVCRTAAQVHATLALAAATALAHSEDMTLANCVAWEDIVSVRVTAADSAEPVDVTR
jgi:hypothetical protein